MKLKKKKNLISTKFIKNKTKNKTEHIKLKTFKIVTQKVIPK